MTRLLRIVALCAAATALLIGTGSTASAAATPLDNYPKDANHQVTS
jgi:hypothetical protein